MIYLDLDILTDSGGAFQGTIKINQPGGRASILFLVRCNFSDLHISTLRNRNLNVAIHSRRRSSR